MGMITQPLIAELEQEVKSTQRVLERITDEHLSWKPHEKSRTAGQLAIHVAQIPGIVSRIMGADEFDVSGAKFNNDPPQSAAELIPALQRAAAQGRKFLEELDDARAMAPWKMMLGTKQLQVMPRIAAIRSIMFNHWYHHRGELVVYLRLLNIPVPSVYGPSADEGLRT